MEHRVIFHSLELFIIEENGGGQPGSGDGEISRDTTRGNIDGITLSGDWLCSLLPIFSFGTSVDDKSVTEGLQLGGLRESSSSAGL